MGVHKLIRIAIVDLGNAVADELYVPFDQIYWEIIYRVVYHFSVAYQKGITTDPVKYFADPENQDLGILKQQRKPRVKLIIAPFLNNREVLTNFFSSLLSNPLDICHTSLTCDECCGTDHPNTIGVMSPCCKVASENRNK